MVISAYYSQMGPSKCGDCGQELDWREEHRCGSSRPERDRRDPFESSPNDFDFPQQPSYLPIQPSHKCGGCNHIITDLSEAFEIEVLNKWYHADCFVCCQCSVAFDDHEPYVPFNGNAYCERDFEMMHVQSSSTEICAACKKPIEETPKYAFGRAFHERHLRCHGCKHRVRGNHVEKDGKVWCEPCAVPAPPSPRVQHAPSPRVQHAPSPRVQQQQQQQYVCKGCQHPILDDGIQACGTTFHRSCFVCGGCSQQLPKRYYVHQQRGYCLPCYHHVTDTVCAECQAGIQGPCIEVEEFNARFHPDCWRCSVCEQKLDTYYSFKGRVYCDRDIDRVVQQRPEKRTTLLRP